MDAGDNYWPDWTATRAYRPHYPDYTPDKPSARIRLEFVKAVQAARETEGMQLELFGRNRW